MAEIRRWNPRQAFEQMKERIEELEEVCTEQKIKIEEQEAANEHLRSRINQLYDVVKHNNTAFDNERMRMNKRIMKLEEVIKEKSTSVCPVNPTPRKIIWDENQCDYCKKAPVKTKKSARGWNLCIICYQRQPCI